MATDPNKLSLSRLYSKARELFVPVVQKYNQVNSAYQRVNNPNVRQMYNQLPQRLEPVRRTYNQVQRPVGNTLATLGTVGQSAYQGTRRIVEPLGYSFGTAVRSPWEQSQINRQKQTSQQTSQRLYNQALQARKQGNPELARRLTLQAQGQFTPIINRQRQLGVDQSRFTKPQMVSSTLKTGASALAGSAGLGSLLATSTLGGGLSAGIAKWQGQDPTQAFGTGIAEALPYAFVNKITDPVYGQIANRVLGQATNPLAKIFAKGGTYGLANLVENEITTRMFEGRGATGMEQVFAGGMGVGYGSGSQAFRELKNADFSAISKKLDIPVEKVKLAYQTIVDSYAQMTPAQRQAGFVDPTAKIGRSSQTKPPTDPLEALKVEARKYKTTVNLQDKNDLEYLERIFSKSTIEDILSGQKTNWRGESYEDLARVNFISETPKTIEQQLAGKIKDYKPASDTFYHGTSADSARKIMGEGFKSGTELPKDAYRGGGYGKIQEGVSFAETPKEAGIFSTLTRDGEIVEAKLKKGAKVVTIDGIEDAVDLADYTKYLKKQGIDAVYIGGGEKELVVLNTKAVTPVKSQLLDLYNQSKLPKVDPLEALKVEARTPQDLASEALKKVGQDPKDAYLTSTQLKKKYAINEDVLLEKELADITERINTFSKLGDTKSNKIVLDRLFKEYSEVSEKLRPSPKPQSQLPKSKVKVEANQPGKLMEANRLDNQALQVDNLTGKSPLVKPLQEQQVPPQSALSPQDLVNTSAKANQLPQTKSQLTKVNQQPGKPTKSQSQPYFNTKNMLISKKAKKVIDKTIAEVKPQIEKATGKKLTNKEVIEKANQSAKVLEGAVGKDQTLAWEASLLKARQKLASLSESGVVDQEYIDALVTVKTHGTDIARKLQSFGIGADPALVTSKQAILEAVLKATDDAEAVLKASKGVDFNDLQQATTFYRKFIKPTNSEWVDLLRYNSMLSSPNTHINNAFSNAQGTGLIAPIEKTIEGSLDAMRSAITGKPRAMFAGEGLEYARGYYSNISTASKRFVDVMRGKQQISNPDTRHIRLAPTGTSSKVESTLNYPMRLLEAADQFFSSLTEGGAKQALEYRAGKMGKSVNSLEEVAQKEAAERLFRSELGDNQGSVALDAIDTVANTVQGLKNSKNPIVSTIAKFTLPFIRTPTNLLKQGVEFSPAGLITLYGAKNKQQLIARSIIGSSVALGTSILLGSDRLTWAEPTGEKQRNKFRAAGLQPYSVKIGNKWISYSKLHPAVSFNIALIAALKDSHDKGDIDDTQLDTVLGGLAKWMNFYADQSYMKNIGDIVSATKGDIYGLSKMVSNYPQQLIPFRALMGWINRIIEPYQRQVNSDAGMLEKQFQYMATQIPGLSGIVPLRMSPDGQPIENQNRLLNAVSPLRVTTQVKDYARPTKGVSLTSTTGSAPISIPTDQETFNELYKKALSNGKGFPMEKTLIENDPTLTEDEKVEKIAKLREKTAQWAETLITMQDKYPEKVFGAELKTYGSNSSYKVPERADWIESQLDKAKTDDEIRDMLDQMWEAGVLTTGKTGTAQELIDRGLNVYAIGNKVGTKSKKAKSGGTKVKKVKIPALKKIAIKSVKYPKVKIVKSKSGNFKAPKVKKIKIRRFAKAKIG